MRVLFLVAVLGSLCGCGDPAEDFARHANHIAETTDAIDSKAKVIELLGEEPNEILEDDQLLQAIEDDKRLHSQNMYSNEESNYRKFGLFYNIWVYRFEDGSEVHVKVSNKHEKDWCVHKMPTLIRDKSSE